MIIVLYTIVNILTSSIGIVEDPYCPVHLHPMPELFENQPMSASPAEMTEVEQRMVGTGRSGPTTAGNPPQYRRLGLIPRARTGILNTVSENDRYAHQPESGRLNRQRMLPAVSDGDTGTERGLLERSSLIQELFEEAEKLLIVGAIGVGRESLSKKDQKAKERAQTKLLKSYKSNTTIKVPQGMTPEAAGDASSSASTVQLSPEVALAAIRHSLNVMSSAKDSRETMTENLIRSVEEIQTFHIQE